MSCLGVLPHYFEAIFPPVCLHHPTDWNCFCVFFSGQHNGRHQSFCFHFWEHSSDAHPYSKYFSVSYQQRHLSVLSMVVECEISSSCSQVSHPPYQTFCHGSQRLLYKIKIDLIQFSISSYDTISILSMATILLFFYFSSFSGCNHFKLVPLLFPLSNTFLQFYFVHFQYFYLWSFCYFLCSIHRVTFFYLQTP